MGNPRHRNLLLSPYPPIQRCELIKNHNASFDLFLELLLRKEEVEKGKIVKIQQIFPSFCHYMEL